MAFQLNEIEKAKMREIVKDPVLWAKAFVRTNDPKTKKVVPWEARDYQAEMLRDTHTRLVFRCGRRCVHGNSMIYDASKGYYDNAERIFNDRKDNFAVIAYNEETMQPEIRRARIWENGYRKCLKIRTNLDNFITVTDNHPVLTPTGWKEAGELKYEDCIAMPSEINHFGDVVKEEKEIRLYATILNCGSKKHNEYGFLLVKNSEGYKAAKKALKAYGAKLKATNDEFFFVTDNEEVNKMLTDYLDIKYIPEEFKQLNKEGCIILINELFKIHSNVKRKRYIETNLSLLTVTYQNKRKFLLFYIQIVLRKFGIYCRLNITNDFNDIHFDKSEFSVKLIDTFKLDNLKKRVHKDSYKYYSSVAYEKKDVTPKSIISILNTLTKGNKKQIHKKLGLEKTYNKSLKSALSVLHHFDIYDYDLLLTSENIVWGRIVSITQDEEESMTYDVEVDTHHNFVVDNMITHNTGKTETMIISALHKIYTKPAFRVLFAAPYEHQINAFWMRIKEILANSPLLNNEVKRLINSPYMLELKNGSAILGFTTGASSGSNAASMRGQRADWLYLDELDYMASGDYDTIAMIAAEREDIGITASSTPTGKRSTFYDMCTVKSMNYHEHYHPSHDNPGFTQEMDDSFKSTMTASAYEHEILAEFGTEDSGVFNKTMIDDARNKFNYCYLPPTDEILRRAEKDFGERPNFINYTKYNPAPPNPYRCMGVK